VIAAIVGGQPIPAAVIDEWLAALPVRRNEENWSGAPRAQRQRRRWMTQVVVGAELARQGCADRGLAPLGAEPSFAPASDAETADLGGIAAAVVQASGHARALLADFAAHQEIPETEIRSYYQRNADRFLTPEGLAAGIDPFQDLNHVRPFDAVRDDIERRLRESAARREFVDWLDARKSGVALSAGYEHPADPAQPDAEHKH